jgi:hypothetical protein
MGDEILRGLHVLERGAGRVVLVQDPGEDGFPRGLRAGWLVGREYVDPPGAFDVALFQPSRSARVIASGSGGPVTTYMVFSARL